MLAFFFFSSRRRHTRLQGDWSSDVCSSDLLVWSPKACNKDGDIREIPPPPVEPQGVVVHGGDAGKLTVLGPPGQIGRASCRERVEMKRGAVGGQRKDGVDRYRSGRDTAGAC